MYFPSSIWSYKFVMYIISSVQLTVFFFTFKYLCVYILANKDILKVIYIINICLILNKSVLTLKKSMILLLRRQIIYYSKNRTCLLYIRKHDFIFRHSHYLSFGELFPLPQHIKIPFLWPYKSVQRKKLIHVQEHKLLLKLMILYTL